METGLVFLHGAAAHADARSADAAIGDNATTTADVENSRAAGGGGGERSHRVARESDVDASGTECVKKLWLTALGSMRCSSDGASSVRDAWSPVQTAVGGDAARADTLRRAHPRRAIALPTRLRGVSDFAAGA